ncbi:MAG: ABC transporter ATP-binding protein [Clostridium sp.]|nr:ABC transporter ATP-binding protein [Clostridium sp.]
MKENIRRRKCLSMKKIIHYLKGYGVPFSLAIISIMIATGMQLVIPILIKFSIDTIIGDEPAGNLTFLANGIGKTMAGVVGLIILISLVQGVFMFLKGYLSNYAAENIAKDLRNRLYTRIQYMSFAKHTTRETGDMIQRCTSDVETIRRFLGVQIADLGRIIFMLVFTILIMGTLNFKLTLYSMVMIPILFIFSYLFFIKIQKTFKKSDEAEGSLTNVLQENLSAVRVVRAFGQEDFEIEKFKKVNKDHRNIAYNLMETLAIFWASSDFLTLIQNGVDLVVGARMVILGEISLGTLTAFITYVSMLLWPVKQLGRLLSELGKTTVSIDRIEDILHEEIEEDMPYEISPELKGSITFEHVSFGYDDYQLALKDVSFHVEAGETLGILGSTGSGKSTLVHLLQRLYDYEGSIKIDDFELTDFNRGYIRKQIGLVLQEPHLYAKTVKENIGITRKDFTDQTIFKAAKTASIHGNILSFKEGYDTVLGEKGVSLSGGQRQRVAIARTIIDENKKILIFDDSLSAVDTQTDQRIRKALESRSQDVTTLIISHRIQTLAAADHIIVLDEGKVIQKGTHEELIKVDGLYRRIWELQQMVG